MNNVLAWISENQSSFISLLGAVIAASVALTVFAITQLLTGRRERTRFYIPKLEELYLLLNSVSEDNVRNFRLVYLVMQGDAGASEEIAKLDETDIYGHKTAKRIIMYIRLYFPSLTRIHRLLFAAQRELNDVTFAVHTPERPTLADLQHASGRVAHLLRLMEQELILNRDHLVKDYFFFKLFKRTSVADVEAPYPEPPDESVMNSIPTR